MQRGLFPFTPAVSSGCDLLSPLIFTLSFLLERWGITWTLNALSIATAVQQHLERQHSCPPPQTCVSNSAISPSLPRARPNFPVSFFFLAGTRCFCDSHFSSRSFYGCRDKLCFLLEQGYWKKSSTTSIYGVFSNLFDVSLHSSFPLVPLHPVLLPFSAYLLVTLLLFFRCYHLDPAFFKIMLHFISCSRGGEVLFIFTPRRRQGVTKKKKG